MKIVYETSTEIDATILVHYLNGCGIPAEVFGGALGVAAGELPVSFLYRVGVPTEAADDAAQCVAEWKNQRPE